MELLDTNVLIAAFPPDHVEHRELKRGLESRLTQPSSVTFRHLVEIAFLRIVSHPKIFRPTVSIRRGKRISGSNPSQWSFRRAICSARA